MSESCIESANQIRIQVLPQAFALLPEKMHSAEAEVIQLAIGLQESRFKDRRQLDDGPARGFWQFEISGATNVLEHPASRRHALSVCNFRGVDPIPVLALEELANDDVLAACFARLQLWNDPDPLPAFRDCEGAWQYYLKNWRPSRPRPETWPRFHAAALSLALATWSCS